MGFYETSMVKDCWATVKLKAAIIDLVKSDSSDISIKKLLAKSGVGRTTFYSHFSNLDQLFCYVFYSDMIQRVPGMYNEDTFIPTVKDNLEYLVANITFYRKALESEGPDSFRQFISDFWYHCHRRAYNEFYGNDPDAELPADVDLEFHIVTQGLSKTAIEKLTNETEVIDPDKYAQIFKTCFSKTLLQISHERALKATKV